MGADSTQKSDIAISLEDAASRRSQTVSRCCLKLSALAGLAILLAPEGAYGHIIQGTQGGFGSGFAHPLTGPDHFLAMFAVGLWSAQMGGRSVWTLPVTFPLIMVIGGVLGMTGLPLPAIEIGIALSILALGGAYLHDCSDCFRLEQLAGWDLHPLEGAALSRRTPEADSQIVPKCQRLSPAV